MNKSLLIGLLVVLVSCHSIQLDTALYKKTKSTTELGTVGKASCGMMGNTFETKAFPEIQNNIRVSVKVLDFDEKTRSVYTCKAKANKLQSYKPIIDSLPVKKQYAVITILDKEGLIKELNAPYNRSVRDYLVDVHKPQLITSIGITITADKVKKLQQSHAYYIKSVGQKNELLLVNTKGQVTATLPVFNDVVLGHKMSKICWATDTRHQWYVADLITGKERCSGATATSTQKKKKTKRLYNL